MGVLDPLERNAEALEQLNDDYSGMINMTLENLEKYAGAILNDRHDLMDEEDPFFFLVWRDDDVMDINSMEELQEEKETLKMFKEDVSLGAVEGRYAKAFVDSKDVEPDYDNPVRSYAEVEELEQKLDGLDERIEEKITEKFDLDQEHFQQGYDIVEYRLLEMFYTLTDEFEALPIPEALSEAEENIKTEKENLLAKAVDEHREHRESVNQDYDRVEIPTEPVDWAEVIEEENIQDFMDISEIPNVTYGDTLHMMMEEICEDIEGVEAEYPLHFTNPGERNDTLNGDRIDNTVRPDAVDDLFVYEFKHMPREQSIHMEENGGLERDEKFVDNVEQLNGYLNDLNMPAGMLVYISSDMEVKEYVVERHDNHGNVESLEEYIHDKEDYDFGSVTSKL
ncbi:MAG: hypothetical protein ABEK10_00275 [Candidatus Nanosalina sp.]